MGFRLGIGNIDIRNVRPFDWAAYWASQPEVLFFGLYSDISGGQMPNRVPGATDYLTVAGVAGSETYQCPNTAPYIAADTDNIWLDKGGNPRTPTTAELITYDFTRTIIKYLDEAPNTIEAIMILSSDISVAKTNNLHRDFWLSLFWSGVLNAYGHLKENRGAERSVWAEEFYVTSNAISDPNGNEINGTSGITQFGLDVGANVFESQGVVKDVGNYAIKADSNASKTTLARIYTDLSVLSLVEGIEYTLSVRARHTGTGGTWNIGVGTVNTAPSAGTLTTLHNVYLTFITYSYNFIYSVTGLKFFVAREQGATDDGGVYIDNMSIKYKV